MRNVFTNNLLTCSPSCLYGLIFMNPCRACSPCDRKLVQGHMPQPHHLAVSDYPDAPTIHHPLTPQLLFPVPPWFNLFVFITRGSKKHQPPVRLQNFMSIFQGMIQIFDGG